MVASSLPVTLTDVFVSKVLTFSLRFKLYLTTSFPSIFSAIAFPKARNISTFTSSSAMTPVTMFPNYPSSVNGAICFEYDRSFPISYLSHKILAFVALLCCLLVLK